MAAKSGEENRMAKIVNPEVIDCGDFALDFNKANLERVCQDVEGYLHEAGLDGDIWISTSYPILKGKSVNSYIFYLKYGPNGEDHLNIAVLNQSGILYFPDLCLDPDSKYFDQQT